VSAGHNTRAPFINTTTSSQLLTATVVMPKSHSILPFSITGKVKHIDINNETGPYIGVDVMQNELKDAHHEPHWWFIVGRIRSIYAWLTK